MVANEGQDSRTKGGAQPHAPARGGHVHRPASGGMGSTRAYRWTSFPQRHRIRARSERVRSREDRLWNVEHGARGDIAGESRGGCVTEESKFAFAEVLGDGEQTALLLDHRGAVRAGIYLDSRGA